MNHSSLSRWSRRLALSLMAVAVSAAAVRGDAGLDRIRQAETERVALIQRISQSVISVFRVNKTSGDLAQGSGSGVIISADGYALTNFHVTGPAEELRVGLPGGRIYKAERLGIDPTGDIAMLKIESGEPLPYAALGSSQDLRVGQWVIAIGNPFLLATDFRPTVSLGIVSGLHRFLPGSGMFGHQLIYADAIQVDAALNPGNSGGPLFNTRGELVGINGRITIRQVQGMRMSKVNMGVGFAVPLDAIQPFLSDLKAGRDVDRGYLGIGQTKPTEAGLEIGGVDPDSPADIYGFRAGDVLLHIDGRPVVDPAELQNIILLKPAGARVAIDFKRGDQALSRNVQLAGLQAAVWLRVVHLQAKAPNRFSVLRPAPVKPATEPSGSESAPKDDAPKDDAAPKDGNTPDAPKDDAPKKGDE